jgi:hypothetical protein
VYGDIQSAIDAVEPGSTLEVRGFCIGPVIITKNLTLVGKATTEVPQPAIFGQEAVRAVLVDRGVTATLRRLEIAFGLAADDDEKGRGGGILNLGTLTLRSMIVAENSARFGGGVANDGTLVVDGATRIHHNHATREGGGIWTRTSMTLRGTTAIHDNTSEGQGGGVAAMSEASTIPLWSLVIEGATVVRKNTAPFGAGIAANGYKVLIADTASVRGNSAGSLGGGILLDRGRLTVAGSATVRGNSATLGGGIAVGNNRRGGIILKGSAVLSGNRATSRGAGIHTFGSLTMSGAAAVRDHTAVPVAVIVIVGNPAGAPTFTMKDRSRVTRNTTAGPSGAAVIRGCDQLPSFVGLKGRVTGNTPKNIATSAVCWAP